MDKSVAKLAGHEKSQQAPVMPRMNWPNPQKGMSSGPTLVVPVMNMWRCGVPKPIKFPGPCPMDFRICIEDPVEIEHAAAVFANVHLLDDTLELLVHVVTEMLLHRQLHGVDAVLAHGGEDLPHSLAIS